MSKLNEQLREICSNGVEYKKIVDVMDFRNGKGHEKLIAAEGKYVVVNSKFISSNGEIKKYSNEQISPLYIDDVLMIMSDLPNGRALAKTFLVKQNHVYTLNQRICALSVKNKNILLPEFANYYLNRNFQFLAYDNGIDQTNLKKEDILNAKIPIPPILIQGKIVHILDSFSFLVAELQNKLQTELTSRKKQYNYYRDTLLSFDNTVKKVKLKDIAADIYRGAGIKREEVTETGIPCVRYGEIYTTYNTWFDACVSHTKLEYVSNPKYFEHGDILFAITGESVEDIAKSVAYMGNEKCLAGGDIVVLKHNQEPRYLAHVLSTYEARKQKSKGKIKSKVVHSSVPAIEDIEIPLPSIEVQRRYADVLDNFEKICNDLNIGLPAEIEARQKQYEYYRDKLLEFKENGEHDEL